MVFLTVDSDSVNIDDTMSAISILQAAVGLAKKSKAPKCAVEEGLRQLVGDLSGDVSQQTLTDIAKLLETGLVGDLVSAIAGTKASSQFRCFGQCLGK